MSEKISQILRRNFGWLLLISMTWCLYLTVLFEHMLEMKPDGLYAGHPYVWADWSLHIAMARLFAFNPPSQWFLNHPVYAGATLNYPFLTNLISGLIIRFGGSIETAFLTTSVVYSWFLCFGLYAFFNIFLRSRGTAYLALCLFFFSSGLGFLGFFRDLWISQSLDTLLYPPQEYSRFMEYGWGSGNTLVGLLVPQRAFLLGLTLACWSLVFYLWAVTNPNSDSGQENLFDERRRKSGKSPKWSLIFGGLLGGLLAITHVHSLMATTFILIFVGVTQIREWKKQLLFALPFGVLSIALYFLFLKGAVNTKNFWVWYPGWTAHNGLEWLIQWSWQWGFTLPTAIIGLWLLHQQKVLWRTALGASFFFLFILGNLFRFQPVEWDNSKIFLWAYLGFSGLSALVVQWIWSQVWDVVRTRSVKMLQVQYQHEYQLRSFSNRMPWRLGAVILLLLLALSGILETLRLIQTDKNQYRMISSEDMALADKIRENTSPDARFLTAPAHDHPIMMWAARPLIMGYTSWVFNYGFPFEEREKDMAKMYSGDKDLLRKYRVSYVVVDEGSRKAFHIDEAYFSKFPVAFRGAGRLIYDVKSITH